MKLLLAVVASFQIQAPIPQPSADALGFARVQFWIWSLRTLLTLVLPLWLLFSGKAQRWAEGKAGRPRWMAPAVLGAGYAILYGVVQMPVDYVQAYAFAPYTRVPAPSLRTWLPAQVGGLLQLLVVGAVVGLIAMTLLRRSRRYAWLWAGILLSAVSVAYLATVPVTSSLASGRYAPLRDSIWQTRFDAINGKVGLRAVPVLIWKTTNADRCRNANSAIGVGPNRAIVLSDQIFEQWDSEMIQAAYAHELKHFFLDNTWKASGLVLLFAFAGTAFAQGFAHLAIATASGRIGILSLQQPAVLVLLAFGLQLFLLAAIPVFNLVSQHIELEADRFSLELTHHNEARVKIASEPCGRLWLPEETLFRQLYVNNHPDMATRVQFARTYKPWESGAPLVYQVYLR